MNRHASGAAREARSEPKASEERVAELRSAGPR